MIKLFTIGFTEKTAAAFFTLLKNAGVNKIIDTRLNNVSQLAGFAKGKDLEFFAKEIGGIAYEHHINLAPTKELLSNYRDKRIDWAQYETQYISLLDTRNIIQEIDFEKLNDSCLLCSEHQPDRCHRRLLAEYLKNANQDIEIIHLIE
ncbi:MAG TPA: hypothetical protein DCL77_21560 [Prolixibacteraceae bacterium]|jgi:uncharacterized protein (DUF488 family)|nr:hypothetical protein [Prolixibacteraceae bacterium]